MKGTGTGGSKPSTAPMGMELQVGTSSSLVDFSLSDIRKVMHSYEVGLIAIAYFLFSTPLMGTCGKVMGFVEYEGNC